MTSKLASPFAVLAAALLAAGPAAALDPIVEQRGWQRVASYEGPGCAAEIRGNGKIFVVAGYGLRPGEVVNLHVTNAGIRPLEYRIAADRGGQWQKYYVPFLWNRSGGRVTVELASASCDAALAFDWARDTAGYNTRYDLTM
jgi:hypothetical protein